MVCVASAKSVRMPQTFLSLGALALLGLITLQQQWARTHEQQRVVTSEFTALARSVGDEALERLDVLAFDAVETTDAAALTPESGFGWPGSGHPLFAATDVDDVDGMAAAPITRTLADPETGATHTLTFAISSEVRYVRQEGASLVPTGGEPTFAKEVVLTVEHELLRTPIELRRVYTP